MVEEAFMRCERKRKVMGGLGDVMGESKNDD